LPALYGQNQCKKARVLLDTYNLKYYSIGPGGYKLMLSPGSKLRQLEESNSGHLMLPCSRFPGAQARNRVDTIQKQIAPPQNVAGITYNAE